VNNEKLDTPGDLVESKIGGEDVHDAHGNNMTLMTKLMMM
jgi:hypothetical protein